MCETNDEIENLLEQFQCDSLRMSREKSVQDERRRAERVFEDLFRHLGQFVRSTADNGTLLITDLRKLNDYLEQKQSRYLLGEEPSFADCVLMPRVQHVRVVAAAFKQFSIPAEFVWLWRYLATMYSTPAFLQSCPFDRDVLALYESKHGVQLPIGLLNRMGQSRTEDIPDAVFSLLEARNANDSNASVSSD